MGFEVRYVIHPLHFCGETLQQQRYSYVSHGYFNAAEIGFSDPAHTDQGQGLVGEGLQIRVPGYQAGKVPLPQIRRQMFKGFFLWYDSFLQIRTKQSKTFLYFMKVFYVANCYASQ